MAGAARRQFHHRNGDLVLQTGFHNALAAVDQIVHIIQRVEVADRGDAVFVHQLRVQFDDVARLRIQTDHVDAARQRLQIGGRSGNLAEIVHHLKRVLIGIEISGLKQRAASRLEVGDSGSGGFFDHRQEVLGKYPRPEYRLETVPERRHHEIYFFHTLYSLLVVVGKIVTMPHEYAGPFRARKGTNTVQRYFLSTRRRNYRKTGTKMVIPEKGNRKLPPARSSDRMAQARAGPARTSRYEASQIRICG